MVVGVFGKKSGVTFSEGFDKGCGIEWGGFKCLECVGCYGAFIFQFIPEHIIYGILS